MPTPILATKLFLPPPRPNAVPRPRLIARLDEGLCRRLTLISAPAGFGKTSLVSEWAAGCARPVAWLSLDEGDNDPARFLAYLIAALRTVAPALGDTPLGMLASPQPPPSEAILTALLNEIAALPEQSILILDDYHAVDSPLAGQSLAFLLEHLPPQLRLVIATREDPNLPLPRYRARGELTELRAADLRFTPGEAAEFLNQGMGLTLTAEDIAALETRTEGWIAGLQLAALSMQGRSDAAGFIQAFTGSHHFVVDYLVEEVLGRQPEPVQTFLLQTAILDRLCGPLCDAVCPERSAAAGQETLEHLEHANLFLVPLDNERRWYRYHHLFADLLRQRLQESLASRPGGARQGLAELHLRASRWFEENGLEIDAFQHAVTAGDVDRAARLVEGKGMPLQFRGAVGPVLAWLETLPKPDLDARPVLWVMYASALSMLGRMGEVEPKLQAAEAALQAAPADEKTRNLVGHIAAIRALLAAAQNQVEASIAQSRRALEYLAPGNLAVRTATVWKLGIAYQLQGDRAAAAQTYREAIAISERSGNLIINVSAATGLGQVQESETQLYQAAETYQRVLHLAGDQLQMAAGEAHLGLARIQYEWNELAATQQHAEQGVRSANLSGNADRILSGELLFTRLKLAQGDVADAAASFARAEEIFRRGAFELRALELVSTQVLLALRQGRLSEAAALAESRPLPLSQARVCLAQGDAAKALELLAPWRRQVEDRGWTDERLKAMVLQAAALSLHGEPGQALPVLADALALAEPGGCVRTFLDEGPRMAELLSNALAQGVMPGYAGKLLDAFGLEPYSPRGGEGITASSAAQPLIEPLSRRELEILRLIAQGLSNGEIGKQLFLALNTVKGHNRVIFDKLQVQNRTQAVARARELDLI